jgi:hypothetical protein
LIEIDNKMYLSFEKFFFSCTLLTDGLDHCFFSAVDLQESNASNAMRERVNVCRFPLASNLVTRSCARYAWSSVSLLPVLVIFVNIEIFEITRNLIKSDMCALIFCLVFDSTHVSMWKSRLKSDLNWAPKVRKNLLKNPCLRTFGVRTSPSFYEKISFHL